SAYVREWEHYRVASDASSKICEYLNRLIMKKDPKDLELNTFTDNKQLYLYNEVFEKPYLEKTRQYYEREAAAVISNDNISQYMKK
ncbi:5464_t:CDS:2, partial [Racocetra fulgida]